MELFIIKILARTLLSSTFPLCQNICTRRQMNTSRLIGEQGLRAEGIHWRSESWGYWLLLTRATWTEDTDPPGGHLSHPLDGTEEVLANSSPHGWPLLYTSAFSLTCTLHNWWHLGPLLTDRPSPTLVPWDGSKALWVKFGIDSHSPPTCSRGLSCFLLQFFSTTMSGFCKFYFSRRSVISLILKFLREPLINISTGINDSWTRVLKQQHLSLRESRRDFSSEARRHKSNSSASGYFCLLKAQMCTLERCWFLRGVLRKLLLRT